WIDRLSLFESLSQTTRDDLAQVAMIRKWPAREIIVHMGDVWPYLFVVMEGEIGAIKESAKGRALTVTSLNAGDVFWGLAFFIEDLPMPVLFQAQLDSTLCMWTREQLIPIIQRNGKMSWILCQLMVSRMQLASDIVEELAFQPVMNRLSNLILEMFGEGDMGYKEREMTLDEMASRIGTTREMVCRHLYRLAEWGAIDVSRTQLRIENRALLEKKAGRT
ncbi:MAG: Crp/Fnr family transcriptional regulator, partial [Anaerolineales bacterium]